MEHVLDGDDPELAAVAAGATATTALIAANVKRSRISARARSISHQPSHPRVTR